MLLLCRNLRSTLDLGRPLNAGSVGGSSVSGGGCPLLGFLIGCLVAHRAKVDDMLAYTYNRGLSDRRACPIGSHHHQQLKVMNRPGDGSEVIVPV